MKIQTKTVSAYKNVFTTDLIFVMIEIGNMPWYNRMYMAEKEKRHDG
ncbi:MAG: hypothetical protein SOY28_03700 [Roseburia sp.]|nr:hypothetical protein [Roseburia sp.]